MQFILCRSYFISSRITYTGTSIFPSMRILNYVKFKDAVRILSRKCRCAAVRITHSASAQSQSGYDTCCISDVIAAGCRIYIMYTRVGAMIYIISLAVYSAAVFLLVFGSLNLFNSFLLLFRTTWRQKQKHTYFDHYYI